MRLILNTYLLIINMFDTKVKHYGNSKSKVSCLHDRGKGRHILLSPYPSAPSALDQNPLSCLSRWVERQEIGSHHFWPQQPTGVSATCPVKDQLGDEADAAHHPWQGDGVHALFHWRHSQGNLATSAKPERFCFFPTADSQERADAVHRHQEQLCQCRRPLHGVSWPRRPRLLTDDKRHDGDVPVMALEQRRPSKHRGVLSAHPAHPLQQGSGSRSGTVQRHLFSHTDHQRENMQASHLRQWHSQDRKA